MSSIGRKTFTEQEKQLIQDYVMQGLKENKTIRSIKEAIDSDGKVEVSYPYIAKALQKAKAERNGTQLTFSSQELVTDLRAKRFSEREKEIVFNHIKEGLQARLSGESIRQEILETEGINVSHTRIYELIKEYKEKKYAGAERLENGTYRRNFNTPAQRLYFARMKVVAMRKNGFTNKEIADEFHVQESDVDDFFLKRRYIKPEQYREIVYKSTKGATPEELAQEYRLNADTVRKILVTKQRAISSEFEPENESQQEFDLNVAKNFIKFINTLMTCKEIRSDEEEQLNEQRQDILHELEMRELTQEEKLAMLDRIAEIGRQRREAKDYNQIFAPVIEFLADEQNMNLIKVFANRVAEAVNKLKDTSTRVYFLRGE